jgi:hypothetical protein
MRSLRPLAVSMAMAWWIVPSCAVAADGWHATQVAGEVRVEIAGAQAVPLTLSMTVSGDALIETAASGSTTLVRGDDRIAVAPNTRLRLPPDDASGMTRVIEEFGALLFHVGKRTQPHFRVEAPLIAATVKGTTFTVTADESGTNVRVAEGLLFVQANASADSTYVSAGRLASVNAGQPMNLYLDRNIVPPAGLRLGGIDSSLGPARVQAEPGAPGNSVQIARSEKAGIGIEANTAAREISVGGLSSGTGRAPVGTVIDSTLTGVGFGIICAALAIVLIGAYRPRPGLVQRKAKREIRGHNT